MKSWIWRVTPMALVLVAACGGEVRVPGEGGAGGEGGATSTSTMTGGAGEGGEGGADVPSLEEVCGPFCEAVADAPAVSICAQVHKCDTTCPELYSTAAVTGCVSELVMHLDCFAEDVNANGGCGKNCSDQNLNNVYNICVAKYDCLGTECP